MGNIAGNTGIDGIVLISLLLIPILIMLPFIYIKLRARLKFIIDLLYEIEQQREVLNRKKRKEITPSKRKYIIPESKPETEAKPVKIADLLKKMEACTECQYRSKSLNKCSMTGHRFDEWEKKFYPIKRVNPCGGRSFKLLVQHTKRT